jgi:hypothetical protein
MANAKPLARGRLNSAISGQWHHLNLACRGDEIAASINRQVVVTLRDTTFTSGFAGLGTGWNNALFDDFTLRDIRPRH